MAPLLPGGGGVGKPRWTHLQEASWNEAIIRLKAGERDKAKVVQHVLIGMFRDADILEKMDLDLLLTCFLLQVRKLWGKLSHLEQQA